MMTNGKINSNFLKNELNRLSLEEEASKKEYFSYRSDLQEIWDKLVSLRTHINKFQTDIENAKIEEIMRGAGSILASNYATFTMNESNDGVSMSIDSAHRIASMNKLKEKIRMKDVLKGRKSTIEERIIEGRKQLARVSDALKALGNAASATATTATIATPSAGSNESILNRNLALRQGLLTISNKINTWEDELVRTNAELMQLESDLSGEINNATLLINTHTPSLTTTNNSYSNTNTLAKYNYSNNHSSSNSSSYNNNSNSNNNTSIIDNNSKSTLQPPSNRTSMISHDQALLDIITHGPALSSSLSTALRSGGDQLFNNNILPTASSSTNVNILSNCEFSLYEVITGQANVVRVNGETPAMYIMRLQRRLSSLLTLELQIQLEFQSMLTIVKQAREQLREVEIKRLRVELQVSNIHNATGQQSSYTIHYQPDTMSTPYSNDLNRTIAFLSAAGSSSSSSLQQPGSREHSRATHSPPGRIKSSSPNKTNAMPINMKHSPSNKATRTTLPGISYDQSVHYAATILKQILQQQAEHINLSTTTTDTTPIKYNNKNNSSSNSGGTNYSNMHIQKTLSTQDIHSAIMQFLAASQLEPSTHYASIVKAIKVQVLSQLLSRDLDPSELQDTALLLSPTTTTTTPATTIMTSKRLHRYFNHTKSPVSPIPLSETLDQALSVRDLGNNQRDAQEGSRDIGNGMRRNKRILYIDATQTATTATAATDSGEVSPLTPLTTTAAATAIPPHSNEKNNKTHSATISPTIKPSRSPNKPNSKHSTMKKKPWVGNKTQTPREIPTTNTTAASSSTVVRSLHSAVSALSESFKDASTLKDSANTTTNSSNSPVKHTSPQWKTHSSVRRYCSCQSCQALSLFGESTDDYDYQTPYNRHGHRVVNRRINIQQKEEVGRNRHSFDRIENSEEEQENEVFTHEPKEFIETEESFPSPLPLSAAVQHTSATTTTTSTTITGTTATTTTTTTTATTTTTTATTNTTTTATNTNITGSPISRVQNCFDTNLLDATVFDVSAVDMHTSLLEDTPPPPQQRKTITTAATITTAPATPTVVITTGTISSTTTPTTAPTAAAVGSGGGRVSLIPTMLVRKGTGESPARVMNNGTGESPARVLNNGTGESPARVLNNGTGESPARVMNNGTGESPARVLNNGTGESPARVLNNGTGESPARVMNNGTGESPARSQAPSRHSSAGRSSRSTSPYDAGVFNHSTHIQYRSPSRGTGLPYKAGLNSNSRHPYCAICTAAAALPRQQQQQQGIASVMNCCTDSTCASNHAAVALPLPAPPLAVPLLPERAVVDAEHSALPAVPTASTSVPKKEGFLPVDVSPYSGGTMSVKPPSIPEALTPRTMSLTGVALKKPNSGSNVLLLPPQPEQQQQQQQVLQSAGTATTAASAAEYARLWEIVQTQQREINKLQQQSALAAATGGGGQGTTRLPSTPLPDALLPPPELTMPSPLREQSRAGVVSQHPSVYSSTNSTRMNTPAAAAVSSGKNMPSTAAGDGWAAQVSVSKPCLRGRRSSDSRAASTHSTYNTAPPSYNHSYISSTSSAQQLHQSTSLSPQSQHWFPKSLPAQQLPAPRHLHSPFSTMSNSSTGVLSVPTLQFPTTTITTTATTTLMQPQRTMYNSSNTSNSSNRYSPLTAENLEHLSNNTHSHSLATLPQSRSHPLATLPQSLLKQSFSIPNKYSSMAFSEDNTKNPSKEQEVYKNASITASSPSNKQYNIVQVLQKCAYYMNTYEQRDVTVYSILHCLSQRIEKLTRRYEQLVSEEKLHPGYDIAVDKGGRSKAYVDLTIVSAKNLPLMKRLSHSADAYIEIQLVTLTNPLQILPPYPLHFDITRLHNNYVYNRLELVQTVYGNRPDLHTESVGERWERAIDDLEQGVAVLSYGRTSVQACSRFPEWREHFHIPDVTVVASQAVVLTLRDCGMMGSAAAVLPQIHTHDHVVGCAVLPLSAPVLQDQHPHSVWLPLQPPHMRQNNHIQPHLHSDCAIKVEVKLHFSEQQYWDDLRTEAVTILEKVLFSLPSPTTTTTTAAITATTATTSNNSTVESLTTREGRRLEKWLEAMTLTSVGKQQGSSLTMPTTTTITTTTTIDTTDTNTTTIHTTAAALPVVPNIPTPAIPPIPATVVPSIPNQHTPHSSPSKHATLKNTNDHNNILYTPISTNTVRTLPSRDTTTTPTTTSYHLSTGKKKPPYRFLGLYEEHQKDAFFKSLRNTAYTDTKTSAKARNSTNKTNNTTIKNKTATTTTTSINKQPPLLPQQQKNEEKEKLKKERQHQIEEERIATLEAELEEVKEVFLDPPMLPIEYKNTQNNTINTRLSQPPPLPQQHKNTENNKERINLSIFKRAGSDSVYQEDRRHKIDKKQQKATINNEKIGFMSGKLRRLQF